jgi:hypothetical protein
MRWFIASLLFAALATGCMAPQSRHGTVQERSAYPTLNQPPAATHTAPASEPVAGYRSEHRPEAVVSREGAAPSAAASQVNELRMGLELYEQGLLRDARVSLSRALDANPSSADEARALETLREINERIFLSTGPEGDLEIYKVEKGDTPARIAQKRGTTWEMIARLNNLSERDIRTLQIGRELKVPKGTFSLRVRKSRYVMDLLLDGQFIQRYEVGLGVDNSTPLGEYTIRNRIPEPADGAYAYGHAKHRLGTRWMGIHNEDGYKGYGIHGCRPEQESEIPGACSQGCVRMRNAEVEELFDIVPVGTRVSITQS